MVISCRYGPIASFQKFGIASGKAGLKIIFPTVGHCVRQATFSGSHFYFSSVIKWDTALTIFTGCI